MSQVLAVWREVVFLGKALQEFQNGRTEQSVMFPFKMTSNSHRLSVFIRTSSTQIPLDHLPRRSCGPSPWHMKNTHFLRLRCQRVSSSYNRPMTRQEENRRHTFPAKTVYLPAMQAVRLFTRRESFAQSERNLHRPQIQIHSDILKSVAVALVVKMIPSFKSAINDISKNIIVASSSRSRRSNLVFARSSASSERGAKLFSSYRTA